MVLWVGYSTHGGCELEDDCENGQICWSFEVRIVGKCSAFQVTNWSVLKFSHYTLAGGLRVGA